MKRHSIGSVHEVCRGIVNVLSKAGSLYTPRFSISLDYWAVPSFIPCRDRSHSWHPSPSTVTQGNTHPLNPGEKLQRMCEDGMWIFLASISTSLAWFLIAMSRHTKDVKAQTHSAVTRLIKTEVIYKSNLNLGLILISLVDVCSLTEDMCPCLL